jgi:two-component system sensor histidine kinase RpfC
LNTIAAWVETLRARMARCPDSEGEQALLRVTLVTGIFLYLYLANAFHDEAGSLIAPFNFGFISAVVVFAWVVVGWVVQSPLNVRSRRVSTTLVDVLATVYGMYATAEIGAPLYAVLMWIIFGTGVRFGAPYLYLASLLGAGGFFVMIQNTPFWQETQSLAWGLFAGLIAIPMYGGLLIRRMDDALRRAKDANSAKSRFLANMSHEVRTPLNGVIGISRLLLDSPLTPRQEEQVSAILGSGRTLLAIVDDILDFSKIEAGKVLLTLAEIDLRQVVEESIGQFLTDAHEKHLSLRWQIAEDVPATVVTDGLHFRQILTNLVSNAVKFTSEGSVEIHVTSEDSGEGDMTLRTEVLDTGIGIPFSLQEKVFEAFAQGDDTITRRYGGSGLGTAICKQLVERLGGDIGLQSTLGEGSRFWFSLPVTVAVNRPLPEVLRTKPSTSVLLVNGDVDTLKRWEHWFCLNGFECAAANESSAAVASLIVAAVTNSPYRAIVVDVTNLDVPLEELTAPSERQILDGETRVVCANAITEVGSFSVSPAVVFVESGKLSDLLDAVVGAERAIPSETAPVGKILVAEDVRTNRLLLQDFLTSRGYEVAFADDGEEALQKLLAEPYDLAIVDMHMPVMDGLDVVCAQRFATGGMKRLPTIVVTADLSHEARERAREVGVDAFLEKPIDLDALELVVRQLVVEDRGVNLSHAKSLVFLDQSVLGALATQLPSQASFDRVLESCVADLRALMSDIEQSLADGDYASAREHLHAIKGSAAPVGARRLAEAADELRRATLDAEGDIAGLHTHDFVNVCQGTTYELTAALTVPRDLP